jgi:hypothetical protein
MTDKLMSQEFLQRRLQAAFRKFNGRYNDLVCQYRLPVSQMQSHVFHTILNKLLLMNTDLYYGSYPFPELELGL